MRKKYVDPKCKISKKAKLHENVFIYGKSVVEDDVEIFGSTYIFDSVIKKGTRIISSVIESSVVGENNTVGPFSHLRPGSKTASGVRVGNFVEIKNSSIGEKSKVSHLAYVGDAEVGKCVNVGCGAIFVNYDGKQKQRIKVGDGAFIGSNCNLIAPLEIGEGGYICAGTTVTKNTQPDDFVIGRVEPTVKSGRAKKYLKREK